MKKLLFAGYGAAFAAAMSGCNLMKPSTFADAKRDAVAEQHEMMQEYARKKMFGEKLPKLEGKKLNYYLLDEYTAEQKNEIKRAVEHEFNRAKTEVVYVKWIEFQKESISSAALGLANAALADAKTNGYALATGKFEAAREVVWQKSVDAAIEGVPVEEVINPVRTASLDLLDTKINLMQWPIIDRELRAIASDYSAKAQFEKGEKALKDYPYLRTYTVILDDKVKAINGELVALNVPEPALAPIAELTKKMMTVAANLADNSRELDEREDKTTLDSGYDPNTEKYRKLLAEYHDALIKYGATPENADKITKKFSESVEELIKSLRRDPRYGKNFLKGFKRLGTNAINKEIDQVRDELLKELEKNRKIRDEKTGQLEAKLKSGDMLGAREDAMKMLSEVDPASDEAKFLKAYLDNLLLTKINPALWAKIEEEFAAKLAEFAKAGDAPGAVKWIYDYKYIRTYPAEIDASYAAIVAEAVKLGVDEKVASSIIDEVAKVTAEKERLASYEDFLADDVTPGKPLTDAQFADYEIALAKSRETLIAKDCTEKNADELIKLIRANFKPEFDRLGADKIEKRLVLGSNALNRRLKALKERSAREIVARVASDYAAAGRFAEARNAIRDVKLTGDEDFDAIVYIARVASLNALVNPLQLKSGIKEIAAKADEAKEKRAYRAFAEWIRAYPGVHDEYARIDKAVDGLRVEAEALGVEKETAREYAEKLASRIARLLEKREKTDAVTERVKSEEALDAALAELESAMKEHYHDGNFLVEKLIPGVRKEILGLLGTLEPITTWTLNERLVAAIAQTAADMGLDALVERERYLALLSTMDGEFSYDSQIAMAEDAIAKQLGIRCPKAHLKANNVLGEYARAMRLLKFSRKLDSDELACVLLGSVYLDQREVFKRAFELGADVNAKSGRDPLARTALMFAIQLGRTAYIHDLVEKGAAVDARDANGETAVHYAARRGNLAVLAAMTEKVDINVVDSLGRTALFVAVERNQEAVVKALLERKADVAVADAKGLTAFAFACEIGSVDVLDPLAAAGAGFGPRELAIAAAADKIGAAEWLVNHGVDVNGEGVMAATVCGTATKRYLIAEGGVAIEPCACSACAAAAAEKASAEAAKIAAAVADAQKGCCK